MLNPKKIGLIFKESFIGNIKNLLSFLNKSSIRKLIFLVVDNKKEPLTTIQVLRVRYVYCAYQLLTEEFGSEFTLKWFSRPSIYLENQTPIAALQHYSPEKMPHIVKAAMACIQVSHGILP